MIGQEREGTTKLKKGRDSWYEEMAAEDISRYCEPEVMDAEDPLSFSIPAEAWARQRSASYNGRLSSRYCAELQVIFDYKEEDIHFAPRISDG
jgi:hypothetical protein